MFEVQKYLGARSEQIEKSQNAKNKHRAHARQKPSGHLKCWVNLAEKISHNDGQHHFCC